MADACCIYRIGRYQQCHNRHYVYQYTYVHLYYSGQFSLIHLNIFLSSAFNHNASMYKI